MGEVVERKLLLSKPLLQGLLLLPEGFEVTYVRMEGYKGHLPETPIAVFVRSGDIPFETKQVHPIYRSEFCEHCGNEKPVLDHIEYSD